LHAEFDNYRKNAIKERSQYLKYAGERLIVELLGVHDNFDLNVPFSPLKQRPTTRFIREWI
jgi:molecular chaperone GrpE (heat shock protein)